MNKLPVMITVDSVADLPRDLAKKYNIMIHPFWVEMDNTNFLDVLEVGAEHLLIYLAREKNARSKTPSRESYEEFFERCSELADEVIHLTMGSKAEHSYERACEAAKKFENVQIFNTDHLSSAMGLVALRGAELAMTNHSVDEILEKMTTYKKHVSSDFVVKDLEYTYRANRISKGIREMSYRFMFRPVLHMKKGVISVRKVVFGMWPVVMKRYIRALFCRGKNIDKRRVFITHVGLDEKTLEFIKEEISRHVLFEEIICVKATAAIACNCGKGTFGVLFSKEAVEDVPKDLAEQFTTGFGGYFRQHRLITRADATIMPAAPEIVADEVEALQPQGGAADAMTVVRSLDFLDYQTGLMYSAEDASLYLEILREFVKDDKSIALSSFLEQESWEDYRILVHALKGTANIIGHAELSEEAKALEFACKDKNYAFVKENHESVMEHYTLIRERIQRAVG